LFEQVKTGPWSELFSRRRVDPSPVLRHQGNRQRTERRHIREDPTMDYLLLIASDETTHPQRDSAEFAGWMGAWAQYNERLSTGGHLIAGAGLLPTPTATTVRKANGTTVEVLDGPFAETKEQLGGFYVISAADLDEALALAGELPIPAGSVEVRPLSFRVGA
jgi:hypothetical protein